MTTRTGMLTERAMLVDLTIRQWSASKHDRTISEEVARQHNSDVAMGRYQKSLMHKGALEKVRNTAADAYEEHRRRTLPWSDSGMRILSVEGYLDYAKAMRSFQEKFESAAEDFCRNYRALQTAAKVGLNSLFKDEDYPAPEHIQGRFSFSYIVTPLPAVEDFRISVSKDDLDHIRQSYETAMQERLAEAMHDTANRIVDSVKHMADKLSHYQVTPQGVEGIFRDSLVDNVRELVNLLPSLNIINDNQLAGVIQQMKDELCMFDADILRKSPGARDLVIVAADDILQKMEKFIG